MRMYTIHDRGWTRVIWNKVPYWNHPEWYSKDDYISAFTDNLLREFLRVKIPDKEKEILKREVVKAFDNRQTQFEEIKKLDLDLEENHPAHWEWWDSILNDVKSTSTYKEIAAQVQAVKEAHNKKMGR